MTLVDLILLGGTAFLLILGLPYAFAIGLVSIAALFAIGVDPIVTVQQMVAGLNVYALLALPCFIIAGDLMQTRGNNPDRPSGGSSACRWRRWLPELSLKSRRTSPLTARQPCRYRPGTARPAPWQG